MIHMLGRKIKAAFSDMYPECTLYHEYGTRYPYAREYGFLYISLPVKGIFHNRIKDNARSGDYPIIQKAIIAFPESVFMLFYCQVGHQAEQGHVPAIEPEAASGNFFVILKF